MKFFNRRKGEDARQGNERYLSFLYLLSTPHKVWKEKKKKKEKNGYLSLASGGEKKKGRGGAKRKLEKDPPCTVSRASEEKV